MEIVLEVLGNLPMFTLILLLCSLFIALFFEFVNGFHDTANAVAMIIYTNSMKPTHSVVMAGFMNFIGVITGGIGVAYSIVHLLPVDILVGSDQYSALVMVYALLLSAVIWNFGTWYFGLPVSSTHSLIGSILGVSLAFGLFNGFDVSHSVNWGVTYGVLIALALSPLLGFGLAYIFMKLASKYVKNEKFFESPDQKVKGRNHPSFWARMGIIATGAGVSYAHGSNDGQKGIGLIMIILIGVLPAFYSLNMESKQYKIMQTRDGATNLAKFYADNNATFATLLDENKLKSALKTKNTIAECDVNWVHTTTTEVASKLDGIKSYNELSPADRWSVRTTIICADNFFEQAQKAFESIDKDKAEYIADQRKRLIAPIEYAPTWVIVAVALAIGIGTMIGYKRIVHTIGEKIGSKPINYMQGTASQATTMATILLADFAHAPVSTTHVLSSSVAGSMVADPDGGVQKNTIKSIVLAWVLTLPITMVMGFAVYYILHIVIGE